MHIHPIKRLGQSFLTYEPAADRIVAALELRPGDEVLEIGPGKGILTSRLIALCRKVTAVEIDRRLVEYLRTTLGKEGTVPDFVGRNPRDSPQRCALSVVQQDILTFDLSGFRSVKVCGNLPYNISSQILFRLLENLASWQCGVFTLQREFALRLLAQPGTKDYGAVTVLFELDTERTRLFNLPPEYFKPRPDVVSTVIHIRRRDKPRCAVKDVERFKRVVRAAFAQRRKTLANNLSNGLELTRPALAEIEQASGIDMKRRAETLSVSDFCCLTEALCAR
jgi:16S rRNA (adenine1518-N6/adenine1519-N6)-dimethyltransferase